MLDSRPQLALRVGGRHNGRCMVYAYVLKSQKDNSYYVGSTKNIDKRFKQHTKGEVKYTKSRLPLKLIFLKEFETYSEARSFEIKIKSWKKRSSIEKMLNKPDNLINTAGSSNGRTPPFGGGYSRFES